MAFPEESVDKPLVSVIVPCYNQAPYLGEALDSVLAQSYPNWECIVVNDGSTDNSEAVAREYCAKDPRIRYVVKQNGGLSSARNFGIKASRGLYILPLDGDDRISSIYVEKAVEALKGHKDVMVVYGRAEFFGTVNKPWEMGPYDFRSLLIQNLFYCTALYRRVDYDKTKGYDESMRDGYEDWDFWIQMLKHGGKVHQLSIVCFYYRQKEVSMFRDLLKDKERLFNASLKVYTNHADVYGQYFDPPMTLIMENEKLNRVVAAYQQSRTYKVGVRINRWRRIFSKGRHSA